jgi:hypothetical protein
MAAHALHKSPLGALSTLRGLLLLLLCSHPIPPAPALATCETNADCEATLMMPGATCNADRLCVSPFSNGGCLANLMPGWNKVRVCHSEDSPEAEALGYCRPPDPGMDYTEIRIASQNWEAVFMEAWMLQILLSEVLGVPATIETGTADAHLDFYDPLYPLDYGTSNHWGPLRRSLEVGDCRLVGKNESLFADYSACAHVVPEVWNLHNNEYYDLRDAGVVEAAPALGVIGHRIGSLPALRLNKIRPC